MKSFYKINQQNDFYTVIANITSRCNFCCKYCCEYCNVQHNDLNIKLSYLNKFIANIYPKIKTSKRKLKLSIYGGEPTLHPDLLSFCNKIKFKYNDIYIEIYSNFSADINLYNELISININFILTAHNNKIFNMENFYNKVLQLNVNRIASNVIFNVMFEKENIQKSIILYNKLYAYFKNSNIVMKLPPLLKKVRSTDSYKYEYSQDELNQFNKLQNENNTQFIKQYVLDNNSEKKYFTDSDLEKYDMCFKNWLCYSGYSSCYINTNGNVFKCQSNFHNKENAIINIYSNYNFNKIIKPHICNTFLCTDYDSKKEKIFT